MYSDFAETPFLGICAYNHQKIGENDLLCYQWHPQIKRTTNLNVPHLDYNRKDMWIMWNMWIMVYLSEWGLHSNVCE